MIRPCDNCDGKGIELYTEYGQIMSVPCPRCSDMPWLKVHELSLFDDRSRHELNGFVRFKPDPSAVMPWCSTHESGTSGVGEMSCAYWQVGHANEDEISSLSGCHIVWIERPTRLDEADSE